MSERTGPAHGPWRPLERWSLLALGLFTFLALAGFASFGRNPALLARFPGLAGFYSDAFALFARGHVVISAAALFAVLIRYTGRAWVVAFVAVCGIALLAEWTGTSTGLPFGEYRYTELLGPRIAGKVPWLIPVSWFLMALPAFGLTAGVGNSRIVHWLLGAALLTAWDFSLDPAMSHLSPYWVWETEGALYGMPLINVAGWLITSFVIMAALDWTGARRLLPHLPRGFLAAYYLTVLAMSFGMVLVSGLWISVAITIPVVLWVGSRRPVFDGRPDASGWVRARGATS